MSWFYIEIPLHCAVMKGGKFSQTRAMLLVVTHKLKAGDNCLNVPSCVFSLALGWENRRLLAKIRHV
jgi:hypothetical protein